LREGPDNLSAINEDLLFISWMNQNYTFWRRLSQWKVEERKISIKSGKETK
jgi:hypothetical protein